ncbi:MAG TPA: hypothetical protein VKK31_29140 [Thermoanaerobaculia bacterium]|nr:hypothetical protein [Thermoanaerobaculia bacterium]
MKLFPGESPVSETSDKHLTLTTHRVRYDQRVSGTTQVIGITLDAVSSCGIISKSYPILLLLAVVASGFGALRFQENGDQSMTYGPLAVAAVLVAAYFLSRTMVLAISSPGESIKVSVTGLSQDALVALVEDVEHAKLKYLGKITE